MVASRMKCVIDQYVKEVPDFSSQYGSSGSISYVAQNLIGKPSLYPEYGDFSASFSMKTYGIWWQSCPSACSCVKNNTPFLSDAVDFVDVKFETAIQPIRVDIYETYNPGSVIRVWGSLEGEGWILLWSGDSSPQLAQARIFSPPIKKSDKFVNMLRLEFDQGCQEYYSALDAIVLVGAIHSSSPSVFHPSSISKCLQNMGFLDYPICEATVLSGIEFILSQKLSKSLDFSLSENSDEDYKWKKQLRNLKEEKEDIVVIDLDKGSNLPCEEACNQAIDGGYFSMLPEELILYILKQIEIQSLCRLACTCKLMKSCVAQSVLYQHLNLKNFWWLVTDDTLTWLSLRSEQLKSLDISWCGGYGQVSSPKFMEYQHQYGHNLATLHMNNCQFADNYCLYIIANTCLNLEVLSLSACNNIDHLGFGELKRLTHLKYLDLSRTRIEFRSLHVLLQHFKGLNHLFLNNCTSIDIDEVALTLTTFNHSLISLDAWKTWPLTSRGLRALAGIKTIQELDLGWALSGTITEGLSELLEGCPGLKKLFLTALRTLTDQDVQQISLTGRNIEQLDLMGTRNITPEAVFQVLKKCDRLKLLDVSYCEQIHYNLIQQWALQFPNVAIKGGFRHQVRII